MKIGKAEAFLAATLAVAALVVGANRWYSAGAGTQAPKTGVTRTGAHGGQDAAAGTGRRAGRGSNHDSADGRSPLDEELGDGSGSIHDPLSQGPGGGPRRARNASMVPSSRGAGEISGGGAAQAAGTVGPPGAVVGVVAGAAGASPGGAKSAAGSSGAQTSASVPAAPGADALAFASDPEEIFSTKDPQQHGELGRISARTGAMSLWVNAEWGTGSQDDAQLLALGDDRLRLVKNVNFLRLEYPNADPPEGAPRYGGIGVPIQGWAADEWHQVTANWNGRNVELYVDGKLVSAGTRDVVDLPDEAKLTVGTTNPGNHPVAPGRLAGVELHRRSLTPIEIDHRFNGAQRR